MKIYFGSDHAGFELKRTLMVSLRESGYEVIDCGPEKYEHEDDYPDYVSIVAGHVGNNKEAKGIVIGYSGQGEAMVCNRFPHVRAAVFYGGSKHILTLSREHNNANILSLGANFLTVPEAKEAVLLWLHTKFTNEERHVRRIGKIEDYSHD